MRSLVALAVFAIAPIAGAQSAPEAPSSSTIEEIPITAPRTADAAEVGILGERAVLETPLSVTSYTADLITDQAAYSVSEVLANDPSVLAFGAGDGNYDNLSIRGFPVTSAALALDGLYGVLPWNVVSTEFAERFEIIRGPSATFTGTSPFGAIGGAISIVPKRAGDDPALTLTGLAGVHGQAGFHADAGRRFGSEGAFGVRANVAHRQGDLARDHSEERSSLIVLGLDYRNEGASLSLDAGYQNARLDGTTFQLFPLAGFDVPDAPGEAENPFARWAFSKHEDAWIALHGELELSDAVTLFAGVGHREHDSAILHPYTEIEAEDGTATAYPYFEPYLADTNVSAQAGLRASFETGPISHALVASASLVDFDTGWVDTFLTDYPTNLYDAAQPPKPDLSGADRSPEDQLRNQLWGFSLADTLSIQDGRYQLTLGLRRQTFEVKVVADPSSSYDEHSLAPSVGVLVRATDTLSWYANYTQGLSQGPLAPIGTDNFGQAFAPIRTEQYETGVKLAWRQMLGTLAFFQIEEPSGFIVPGTNRFDVAGEQRNRGLELTLSGSVGAGVHLLGGATWIDADLVRTDDPALDGNRAPGVPELLLNLGGEWDVPFAPGITLSTRVVYASRQYLGADNTQRIPAWARWDLGARYAFAIAEHPVTMRINAVNLAGARYWASTAGGGLSLGSPRSAELSFSVDF
jgi:iron complex outermembrane receptor protein